MYAVSTQPPFDISHVMCNINAYPECNDLSYRDVYTANRCVACICYIQYINYVTHLSMRGIP